MKKLARICGVACTLSGLILGVAMIAVGMSPGCAHLAPVINNLPQAEAYAKDAQVALVVVRATEQAIFATAPNPALQAKIEIGISDAQVANDAGLKICQGTQALSQVQIAEAFQDFQTAYVSVMALLGPLGVQRVGAPGRVSVRSLPPGTRYVISDPAILSAPRS